MKTILIATDFSNAANNAAAYGVELAKTFNARVILFSACQELPVPVSEVPVIISIEELQLQTNRQLADEARLLFANYGIPVSTCCKTGTTRKAILETVEEHRADLVVTGMKKKGKAVRRIVGSAVTELIGKIQVPMIVVPEETKFNYVAKIALATEGDISPETDTHILDELRLIAERFHSKVFLVRVTQNRFAEAYEMLHGPFQLKRILRSLDPALAFPEGKNVPESLGKFIESYNINLLAMMPHKHSLFERWFVKSNTRAMAFECAIPLLILPDKQAKIEHSNGW